MPDTRYDPALPQDIDEVVQRALQEDLGAGDITAQLVPRQARLDARIIGRESAVLCGIPWCQAVFRALDPAATVEWQVADGDVIAPGQVLCRLQGSARALLSGERTALNFLQTLSGTATLAHRYAQEVRGLPVQIFDTRKTLPGLRSAQKYAVACGGCHNHRQGLYDSVLLKENHIHVLGSVTAAVQAARHTYPGQMIEVEVEDLQQLQQAIEAGADTVLLDNFDVAALAQAVALNRGQVRLEASGGITLDNIRACALTGIDCISIGALTKDVRAIDLSMRYVTERPRPAVQSASASGRAPG